MLRVFTWLVLAMLLSPILLVFASAFGSTQYMVFPPQGFSLHWFGEALRSRDYVEAFWYSLTVAAATAAFSTMLGGLVALALVRHRFSGRAALNALVMSPLILPPLLIGVALLQWLSILGIGVGTSSLIMGHVIVATPYAVRLIASSLAGFDRSLELAARSLGAPPLTAFVRITVPLISTGLLAAAVFSFIVSFDNVTVSIFLATPRHITLPVRMYSRVEGGFGSTLAAVSAMLIGLTVVLIVLTERLTSLRALFLTERGKETA